MTRAERVRREAQRLLEAGVAGQAFPGATACVAWRDADGEGLVEAAAGSLGKGLGQTLARTPYDLASLTKPVVATAALRLADAGQLDLELVAEGVLTDVRGGVAGGATLAALLTHTSGLASWGGLFLDVPHEVGSPAARRWLLNEAARRPEDKAGGHEIYSDLGYMLGGEVVARVAGAPLDRVVTRWVLEPLGIEDDVYFAGALPSDRRAALARTAAPTERCEWRGRIVRGEVHDENCAALGGVSGHAGLFGNARGMALFGRGLVDVLAERSTFLKRSTLEAAIAATPEGAYGLGFMRKPPSEGSPGGAAGRRLGPRTFGHLGFTGTSFWCDPDRDLSIALLTNRIHPSRANEKIKGFRPAFHDGIAAAFG
ncbi:MAG: serine hydrolase domain-containing protein [Myxococcota bacterium]